MDDSQSSDFFPKSIETSNGAPEYMDTVTYESLVTNTKQALSAGITRESEKVNCCTYFTTVLEDCATCINQSLNIITDLTLDTEVCITKLTEYLNEAVCLLQLLSDFIKSAIEFLPMRCCSMKTFPSTTGLIIMMVFTHCKDSESLYGNSLGSVEKQLKDLFRNCHDLQLIYLMILEKHFIFDSTEMEEKDILIEALNINLKIVEIVECLDVKTMAEQWKSYTTICEKYSEILYDTNIFQDCSQNLSMLIKNNIKTAAENKQDEKAVMRSLKVASFGIKILLKICNIFRHANKKDYDYVIDLLFFIHETRFFRLEMPAEKSQFTNLVRSPVESLLKELLSDEVFSESLFGSDVEKIKQNNSLLAFIMTVTSVMKCLTQGHSSKTVMKSNLINCVFNFFPNCHLWNFDVTIRTESSQFETHGLFEHLLIHTASLAFTLNSEEYSLLERNMIEAILGIDCCGALFSTNLWVLMARHVNPQLLFNQVIWLCTMFKKLDTHKMFSRSPQKIHLSYTIGRLFEVMESDDKIKICKQFRIHDDDNISLWIALGVNNLPDEVRCAGEEVVAERLKTQFQSFNGSDGIDKLTKLTSLAATCSFTNTRGIEDCIVKSWSKLCPKHQFAVHDVVSGTVWFYEYLQALVYLTDSMWHRLCMRNENLIKILHSVSSLIQRCSIEFKLLLINLLCKLATSDICPSKLVDDNFADSFSCLSQDSEDLVRNKLFSALKEYKCDKNMDKILSKIEDDSLRNNWSNILNGEDCSDYKIVAMDSIYTHKCFDSKIITVSSNSSISEMRKTSSSNLEFADIDNLFVNKDSEVEEPMCKKVKLEESETEDIVKKLETNATLLCNMKENLFTVDYRNRIQNICDKLQNIIN